MKEDRQVIQACIRLALLTLVKDGYATMSTGPDGEEKIELTEKRRAAGRFVESRS